MVELESEVLRVGVSKAPGAKQGETMPELSESCKKCGYWTRKKGDKFFKCYTSKCPANIRDNGRTPGPMSGIDRSYFVVYLDGTDGDIAVERRDPEWIKGFVKEYGQEEIAIVRGRLIKGFDSKVDLTRL